MCSFNVKTIFSLHVRNEKYVTLNLVFMKRNMIFFCITIYWNRLTDCQTQIIKILQTLKVKKFNTYQQPCFPEDTPEELQTSQT